MQPIDSVAVIGAGVSGVSAGVHLHKAGLSVTLFERGTKAGGVWVYDERVANEPSYPAVKPSVGDSPEYVERVRRSREAEGKGRGGRGDSPIAAWDLGEEKVELELLHAPPGPCYVGLRNNVSTTEMELKAHRWEPGTEDIVEHGVLEKYIQDTARYNGIEDLIRFGTRVQKVEKSGARWRVETSELLAGGSTVEVAQEFDAVVVASGHYHACNVPDIPGLAEWKKRWPEHIMHSKRYRRADDRFRGKNVLLIGSGVSSMDIAKELGPVANKIYQTSRGGPLDLPAFWLPPNGVRLGEVVQFETLQSGDGNSDELCGTVQLRTGHRICEIGHVILCTGYHVSYPFLSEYHSDGVVPEDADDEVIVTDGTQTHNLHKDIFYLPDPTLAFVGVPYHVATFSLFEFQAIALAAIYSGEADLPSREEMRAEYKERLEGKGAGRFFHSLKSLGAEDAYVNELLDIINENKSKGERIEGHTQAWHASYARRVEKHEAVKQQALEWAMNKSVFDEALAQINATCV